MADRDIDRPSRRPASPAEGLTQHPLIDLRRQMDDLFDQFSRGFGLPAWWGGAAPGAPGMSGAAAAAGVADVRFEVTETDSSIVVSAELPGMDENDIDVQVDNGVLTIQGEKSAESDKTEADVHVSERSYGAFRRAFRLPDTVDPDSITAEVDKGVLRVTLPKRAESQSAAKKIGVRRG